MALNVKLMAFEGPLDLLLHLIDKNKVDIYDIPIVTITEQYLDYVRQMETEDMNVMSEFLVMAATLIDIKCRMLLPAEVNEEGEEEDPRAELVEKLLEYKMYKYMSFELRDRQIDAQKTFFKGSTMPKEITDYTAPIDYNDLIGDLTLAKLHSIFKDAVKRQNDRVDPIRNTFGNIEKEEIDLEAKEAYIRAYIRNHHEFSFRKLLELSRNKMEIIITFLIVLELIKIGQITIHQDAIFDDITVTSNVAA